MRWECSECGGRLEVDRPPMICGECGLAGAIFVETGPGEDEPDDLRAAWLRAGLERRRPGARPLDVA